MRLILDQARFDTLQAAFTAELVERIRIKLIEAGICADQLEDLTASIALSITGVIDDLAPIPSTTLEVHPYLTFRLGEDELIHCGENAYTYDQVYGVMQRLFRKVKG
ncbi:hypothetical protein GWK36_04785 [Caldichromatium japonicum]|uniref:Uncharacterized protein n=1 Tax=Caldichromatium japonicum TaxID=2699430 RepID=A0A6G7VBX8_9GAMM|nr:hypothetical protein [Caldichromatium japonicum]QIK37410.1 hypothetical protein GWK36_04785 [Caldichromatium japonicum]